MEPIKQTRKVLSTLISAALVLTSIPLPSPSHAAAVPSIVSQISLSPKIASVTDYWLPAPVSEYRSIGVTESHPSRDAGTPTRRYADTVILIQDLHLHYPTQKRIVKILDYLYDKNIVSGRVAVEGLSGDYDTSILANYPSGKLKTRLVDYFLSKGEMSGDEAFSILRGEGHRLFGVDEPDYYKLNRELYKGTLQSRHQLKNSLDGIGRKLAILKKEHYPYGLKRLDRQEAYDVRSAEELLKRKLEIAKTSVQDEKEVALVQNLAEIDHSLSFLSKLLRQETTLEEVRYVAQRLPAFVEITQQLLRLESRVPSPESRVKDPVQNLNDKKQDAGRGTQDAGRETQDAGRLAEIEEVLKSAIDFYAVALMRDEPLAKNTLALLRSPVSEYRSAGVSESRQSRYPVTPLPRYTDTVVLVAGGFHTAGMIREFKKAGVGYVVITPYVDEISEDYHQLYEARMKGEHANIEDLARDLQLPPQALASGPGPDFSEESVAVKANLPWLNNWFRPLFRRGGRTVAAGSVRTFGGGQKAKSVDTGLNINPPSYTGGLKLARRKGPRPEGVQRWNLHEDFRKALNQALKEYWDALPFGTKALEVISMGVRAVELHVAPRYSVSAAYIEPGKEGIPTKLVINEVVLEALKAAFAPTASESAKAIAESLLLLILGHELGHRRDAMRDRESEVRDEENAIWRDLARLESPAGKDLLTEEGKAFIQRVGLEHLSFYLEALGVIIKKRDRSDDISRLADLIVATRGGTGVRTMAPATGDTAARPAASTGFGDRLRSPVRGFWGAVALPASWLEEIGTEFFAKLAGYSPTKRVVSPNESFVEVPGLRQEPTAWRTVVLAGIFPVFWLVLAVATGIHLGHMDWARMGAFDYAAVAVFAAVFVESFIMATAHLGGARTPNRLEEANDLYRVRYALQSRLLSWPGHVGLIAQRITPKPGAKTGQVSADDVLARGATGVLVGHSETRMDLSDNDERVNAQLRAASKKGFPTKILAVGEDLDKRDKGKTKEWIRQQLQEGLAEISPEDAAELIIAYEPIWAIGTGRIASEDDIQDMANFIRGTIESLYGAQVAGTIRILYGGSVKPENIEGIMRQQDVDGVLVGGASQNLGDFQKIMEGVAGAGAKNGRRPFFGANWKANEIRGSAIGFVRILKKSDPAKIEVGMIPSLSGLSDMRLALARVFSPLRFALAILIGGGKTLEAPRGDQLRSPVRGAGSEGEANPASDASTAGPAGGTNQLRAESYAQRTLRALGVDKDNLPAGTKLFWPEKDFMAGEPLSSIQPTRSAKEALRMIGNSKITFNGYLRGVDGAGSSNDLPGKFREQRNPTAKGLGRFSSTPTFASTFKVQVSFEKSDNPEAIEYDASQYNVHSVYTEATRPNRDGSIAQKDAANYIFRLFGLRGIRITLDDVDERALAGGMGTSGAFNLALIEAANALSGAGLSEADMVNLGIYLENSVFMGLTGGQEAISTLLGGGYLHIWLRGFRDEQGQFPNGFVSIPLPADRLAEFSKHAVLLQAGKTYVDGKAEQNRFATLTNIGWTDGIEDGDPYIVARHLDNVRLTFEYVEAFRKGDWHGVARALDHYVRNRDENTLHWINIALDWHEKRRGPSYAKKWANRIFKSEDNPFYAQFRVVRDLYFQHGAKLREMSLYTLDPLGAEIAEARNAGIALFPLGAGGPTTLSILFDPQGMPHMREAFLELSAYPEMSREAAVQAMTASGWHELKGYVPYEVGMEPAKLEGLQEVGFEPSAGPIQLTESPLSLEAAATPSDAAQENRDAETGSPSIKSAAGKLVGAFFAVVGLPTFISQLVPSAQLVRGAEATTLVPKMISHGNPLLDQTPSVALSLSSMAPMALALAAGALLLTAAVLGVRALIKRRAARQAEAAAARLMAPAVEKIDAPKMDQVTPAAVPTPPSSKFLTLFAKLIPTNRREPAGGAFRAKTRDLFNAAA